MGNKSNKEPPMPYFFRDGLNNWGINKDDNGYFILLGDNTKFISGHKRFAEYELVTAYLLHNSLIEMEETFDVSGEALFYCDKCDEEFVLPKDHELCPVCMALLEFVH